MAAILQLRRGTTASKPTLSAGEMYVNTTSQSLQVSIDGSTEITLAKLNSVNSGSFNVSGDITLGGTITIGDATSDNLVVNADLSSSIIPNNDNAFDLGSATFRYRNLNATSISGAIASTNGVISGSSQLTVLNAYTASANIWSGSIDSKFITLLSVTASYNTATASLNTFSASVNGHIADINTKTGSFETKNTSLATISGSLISTASFLEAKNLSLATTTGSLILTSSFLEAKNLSLATISGSLILSASNDSNKFITLASITASYNSVTSSLNAYTTSAETKFTSIATVSGSLISTASFLEAKNLTLATYTSSLNIWTSSVSTTGSNSFNGNQTITGSLVITQNLTVLGSSSINIISQSTLNIGTNLITVNVQSTSSRFGGFAVIDSGSSPARSGSWLFDSINDNWIMVHQNASTITSSVALMGAETYNNVGVEIYPTLNRVVKGLGYEHIGDSNITDTGTEISLNSLTSITGSLFVSGSSTYIRATQTTISGSLTISGSSKGNVVPITITSLTASLDMSLGNYFTLTLANTTNTHIRATNITPGTTATLLITTGTNSSASLSPSLLQSSNSIYTASFGTGKKDLLSLSSFDSTNMYVVSTKDLQ